MSGKLSRGGSVADLPRAPAVGVANEPPAPPTLPAPPQPFEQTAHGVIGRVPDWWIAQVEIGYLKEVLEARERVIRLWDSQPDTPVFPALTKEHWTALQRANACDVLLALREAERILEDVAASARLMVEDPFEHGWEPPMWRKILLWMARKRLELPNEVITFYVLGGKRSGKTDLGGKRAAQHTAAYRRHTSVGQYVAWTWCVHQNETRSKDLGQKRVYDYLPRAWQRMIGKKGGGKLRYEHGTGFTGNMFIVLQRLCGFVFSGMDNTVLQGPELTFAWLDEEQARNLCKTVKERLTTRAAQAASAAHQHVVRQCLRKLEAGETLSAPEVADLHLGFCLHTFTPEEGWTPVVADALNGAVTLEEEPAEALPIFGKAENHEAGKDAGAAGGAPPEKPITGYEMAPRVKQCRRPNEMIFYIWSKDNPWGGYAALLALSKGMGPEVVRINLYGDVRKSWMSAYPGFDTKKHVMNLDAVPREVTVRRYVDCAESRPMFTIWVGTDRAGRDYVLNEWPREGDYIPGEIGDPGAWAVPSTSGKKDGDQGPAQRILDFGFNDYIAEWKRVERQLAAWMAGESKALFLSDEDLKTHEPVPLWCQQMDSRLGNAPTINEGGKSTLINDFNKLGCEFEPAAGDRLKEGNKKINHALRGNTEGLFVGPLLFVTEHCQAVRFMLENYTGFDGKDGACKDPRDALVFHLTNDDPGFKGSVQWTSRGGRKPVRQ